jgi:hypothetical protein
LIAESKAHFDAAAKGSLPSSSAIKVLNIHRFPTNPSGVKGFPLHMRPAHASQIKPMTIWCLAAIVLVASVLVIGVTLFHMPGSTQPLEKHTPAAVSH